MSENEYKELIDFLGKNFERIDERFEKIDERFEDARRHTGVLIEAVNHRIDLLVEGMTSIRQGFEKDKDENEQEHSRLEKMTLVNLADIATLDQRVGRLEEKI